MLEVKLLLLKPTREVMNFHFLLIFFSNVGKHFSLCHSFKIETCKELFIRFLSRAFPSEQTNFDRPTFQVLSHAALLLLRSPLIFHRAFHPWFWFPVVQIPHLRPSKATFLGLIESFLQFSSSIYYQSSLFSVCPFLLVSLEQEFFSRLTGNY